MQVVILLMIFIGCKKGQNKIDEDLTMNWIPFEWTEVVKGKDTLKHASMQLKASINDYDDQFVFQFDLGAGTSSIYEVNFKTIFQDSSQYPFKINKKDSTKWNNIISTYKIEDMVVKMNSFQSDTLKPLLLRLFGDKESAKNENKLGTLGIDIVKDKYLFIDYKRQNISILDSLPRTLEKEIDFIDFVDTPLPHIIINILVDEKEHLALFDTGSSAWTIASSKSKFNELLGNSDKVLDSIVVSSWGKRDVTYKSPVNKKVSIGKKEFENFDGYFIKDDPRTKQFEEKFNLEFLIGNTLFLEDILVLDLKNKKFGIAKSTFVKLFAKR